MVSCCKIYEAVQYSVAQINTNQISQTNLPTLETVPRHLWSSQGVACVGAVGNSYRDLALSRKYVAGRLLCRLLKGKHHLFANYGVYRTIWRLLF